MELFILLTDWVSAEVEDLDKAIELLRGQTKDATTAFEELEERLTRACRTVFLQIARDRKEAGKPLTAEERGKLIIMLGL